MVGLPLKLKEFHTKAYIKKIIYFYKRPSRYARMFETKDFSYSHDTLTPTSIVICALLSSDFAERKIQSSEAKVVYISFVFI